MQLTTLLKGLDYNLVQGSMEQDIHGISHHSKDVEKDYMFIAISGFKVDGHLAVNEAIANGATAILVEKQVEAPSNTTIIQVEDTREALAMLSASFYEHPTATLNTIGITGTNGKTSITHLLQAILEENHKTVGTIGTLGTIINGEVIPTANTTPDSLQLQQFLSQMIQSNQDYCLMEVSSHALSLKRVSYMKFSTGIFTNLSPDHLELHKTMEEYFQAKAKLFEMTDEFNIINADDVYGQRLIKQLENSRAKTITYGIHEKADFYATDITYSFDQTSFTLHTPFETERITIHLPGEIYVLNSLAAIAAAYYNGVDLQTIKSGLANVKNIKGRFEVVYNHHDFNVIVDFAHTEDALYQTISILRPFVKGRVIVVFGVYADMSESGREKRYGMGRVAAENADFSIVTLDNPKQHDIKTIMRETTDALESNNGSYIAIEDREKAIQYAIEISKEDDCILIAGKGHETTQIIGDKEIYFSEKEIVEKAMENKTF